VILHIACSHYLKLGTLCVEHSFVKGSSIVGPLPAVLQIMLKQVLSSIEKQQQKQTNKQKTTT